MLKNKPFWSSVTLIAVYLLLGYFAVPHWLQPRLEQYFFSHLGRELSFSTLQFDPITWSATLQNVQSTATGQGLLPGVSMTADAVHMRFNFWRLKAAISDLRLQAPVLVIDAGSDLMQSGRYPFFSEWANWTNRDMIPDTIPIRRWRVDSGRLEQRSVGAGGQEQVLLDQVFLKSGKNADPGLRDFSLAMSTAEQSELKLEGVWDQVKMQAAGQYQLSTSKQSFAAVAATPPVSPTALPESAVSEGSFTATTLADQLLIKLNQSRIQAGSVSYCLLNELLCASVQPLQAVFDATVMLATDGITLESADVEINSFNLDSSMGGGKVVLSQEMAFQSARLTLLTPTDQIEVGIASDGMARQESALKMDLSLLNSEGQSIRVEGRYHPESEWADLRFDLGSSAAISGELKWQWIPAQQAEAAHSQLDLLLENRAATLINAFQTDHFSGQMEADLLQLHLAVSQQGSELEMQEGIRLEQARLAQDSAPLDSGMLDVRWLLALLRDPGSEINIELPVHTLSGPDKTDLESWLEAPLLPFLNGIVEQPFAELARLAGNKDLQLADIQFEAGSAELNAESDTLLGILAQSLIQRPGLGIELAGVYDPLIDKKELQEEQVRTHIALASAAELSFQSGEQPTDFTDPVVHSVIDEFAGRRLPAAVMKAFAEHFGVADVDRGVLPEGDVSFYYAALFELLVDYAEIPQGALTTLARYRAQTVTSFLIRHGLPEERLLAQPSPETSVAGLNGIPLSLKLRIESASGSGLLQSSSPESEIPESSSSRPGDPELNENQFE